MGVHEERILFEDEALLAVNKRSGELVVKGAGRVDTLPLYDYLKKDYPGLRVLHRLDFETSGVVLFAKTRGIEQGIINDGFPGWKKTYRTLVMGRPLHNSGTIRLPLPARGQGKVPAVTHYRVLKRYANSADVELQIETGRYHQIRRHMALIGHPLALDTLYGHKGFNQLFTRELGYRTFFLHASELAFTHPQSGKTVTVTAPLPKPFAALLKRLGSLQ